MAFLNDITMQQLVTRLLAMAVLSVLFGLTLAAVARAMGDAGPWQAGRGSLNPAAQLAWPGIAMAVLFGRGWARPVRLSAQGRGGRLRVVGVVAAGLLLPLLVLPLGDWLAPRVLQALPRTGGYAVLGFIRTLQEVTLASVLLNALPVPGLVAGNLWRALRPAADKRVTRLENAGLALIAILLVLDWLPGTRAILAALQGAA